MNDNDPNKNKEGQAVRVGRMNDLAIVRESDYGLYLEGGQDFGEILLPRRYVPKTFSKGQKLRVFVYFDSEDRVVATTEKPFAMVDEFAALKVLSVNDFGAFLDWGLSKDLLLPFNEQLRDRPPEPRKFCVVRIFQDQASGRIAASMQLDKFLDLTPARYEVGQEVSLMIARKSDVGIMAIINSSHWGLLYREEVFDSLKPGEQRQGFIKRIREDGKIDLSLYKLGYGKVGDITDSILTHLNFNNGFLAITDKTPPALIYEKFGVSKKTYKKAIGSLYKKRIITIEPNGIRLVKRP